MRGVSDFHSRASFRLAVEKRVTNFGTPLAFVLRWVMPFDVTDCAIVAIGDDMLDGLPFGKRVDAPRSLVIPARLELQEHTHDLYRHRSLH
jgi:hypothetical protein